MTPDSHRPLRVLLPCEIPARKNNPYVLQLLHYVQAHEAVATAQHGVTWLRVPEVRFDVVHFQWPEAVFHWQEPSVAEMNMLAGALDRWTNAGTRIVSTVHNEYPHYRDTPRFRELYDLLYSHTDAFVHLGEASKEALRNRYAPYAERAEERVIPHGNYAWFPNDTSREAAREQLGLDPESKIVLVFGAIRHSEELTLLMHAFRRLRKRGYRLLLAGRLPYPDPKDWRHYPIRLWYHLKPSVDLHGGFIPEEKVQLYLNAADLLVIPRTEALNSGNVPLGFTFGHVVVGPDLGVIGEELRATSNPTYDPVDPDTLTEAIESGYELALSGKGEANAAYAGRHWNWNAVGNAHIDLYDELLHP